MEPLSQLDVQNPDHVSVITRDGKLTVSVIKDGASVTLGFPIKPTFNTTPFTPSEQPVPKVLVVKDEVGNAIDIDKLKARIEAGNRPHTIPGSYRKLTPRRVREMKTLLNDEEFMRPYRSKQEAYRKLAWFYNISLDLVRKIQQGRLWSDVTI